MSFSFFFRDRLLFLVVILGTSCSLFAQGNADYLQILKDDIAKSRQEVIWEYMELSAEEEAAILPVFEDYQAERKELSAKYEDLLTLYARVYQNMSDEVGKVMVKKYLEIKKGRYKLNKRYAKKFSKALGYARGAKFVQINNQVDIVIDATLASKLPLIE